jgi:hypothetical protein
LADSGLLKGLLDRLKDANTFALSLEAARPAVAARALTIA